MLLNKQHNLLSHHRSINQSQFSLKNFSKPHTPLMEIHLNSNAHNGLEKREYINFKSYSRKPNVLNYLQNINAYSSLPLLFSLVTLILSQVTLEHK